VTYLRVADVSCTRGVRESTGLSYGGPCGGVPWHNPIEWLDAEIKLFIKNKGPFNLYAINYRLKSRLLTPLISFATLALTAELPLPTNDMAPPINTLNTQPTEAKATVNYSRDLATLAKMYIEESKYSREDNNFNCKLMIFNDLCDRVDIL